MSDIGFGLHISERFTRICDYKIENGKIQVTAMGVEATHPTFFLTDNEISIDQQAATIKRLYTSLHIAKKGVHVVIPDTFTFAQIVEMPRLKEKELLASIRYQADEFIPMPIEETNLDIEILNDDERRKKVMLLIVASPKKIADQIEKTLAKADLQGESLENELSAVGRLTTELGMYKTESVIMCNFGFASTSFYLLDSKTGIMQLARTVKIGWELFLKDVKVNLNISEDKAAQILQSVGLAKTEELNVEALITPVADELMREIEKIFLLARDKYGIAVARIVLFNFDNQIAHLRDKIQIRFSLPTESMNIAKHILSTPTVQTFASSITAFIPVIGAALR